MRRSLISWALAILLLAACTPPAAPDAQDTARPTPEMTSTPAVSATPVPVPTATPQPDSTGTPVVHGQAEGVLVHPDTGEPVTGLWLLLMPVSEGGVGIRPSEIRSGVRSDETGAFLFADLVPRRYVLQLDLVSEGESAAGAWMSGLTQRLRDEQGSSIYVGVASGATTDLGTIPLLSDALPPSLVGMPRFVNHAEPEWEVDPVPLKETGCLFDLDGGVHCPEGIDSRVLDCNGIGGVSPLLGALEPRYPIAQCLFRGLCTENVTTYFYQYDPTGSCFFCVRGRWGACFRYLVYRDGQFILIRTEDEFRATFAPIETADEALSYVLAVTGLEAYYGLHLVPQVEYFRSVIEDTHVDPVDDGYVVHLFQEAVIGCGTRSVFAVELFVASDGRLEQISRAPVYHQPATAGCRD